MPISKITAPSETPTAVADYQAQNNLLSALLLAVQGAERIVGSNVVKGAVFQVGGATYLATADTAITGSASDYVKLTVSEDGLSLAPSYVADLTGVTWSSTYNGYYDVGGNLYIFDESKAYLAGAISEVYSDLAQSRLRSGIKYFSASGSFRVPKGVTTVFVTAIGGGGNGGNGAAGSSTSTAAAGGGSGGSGASCFRYPLTVVPGTLYAVSIGAAAATSFGALLSVPAGGNGGNASGNTPGSAGAAGAATAPRVLAGTSGSAGNAGVSGTGISAYGGRGGDGAEESTVGILAPGGLGGPGSSPYLSISSQAGAAGTAPGAGGGGGGGGIGSAAPYSAASSGAAGAAGLLVVEW